MGNDIVLRKEKKIFLSLFGFDFLFLIVGFVTNHMAWLSSFFLIHGIIPLCRGKLYFKGKILRGKSIIFFCLIYVISGILFLMFSLINDLRFWS